MVLVQGSSYSVEIEADENLMQYINVRKHNGNLELSEKDGYELRSKPGIKIRVQMPVINEVSMAGAGSIKGETALDNPDDIKINIAGSGDIILELKTPKADVEIAASGKAILSGSTRKLDISIGGSGDCVADDLLSENCT